MEIYLVVECYKNRRFNIAAYYTQNDVYSYKKYLETYVVGSIDDVTYDIEKMIVN